MKTNFVRNQKISETCLDIELEGDGSTMAYFLDENETHILIFMDWYEKGFPEEVKQLNLNCDVLSTKSEAEIDQIIPAGYSDYIMLIEKRGDKLINRVGYEISLTSNED